MALPPDQVEELRKIHSNLSTAEEAGQVYILLEGLNLPEGCSPAKCDALLCPSSLHGYEARLFFSAKISSHKQLNWHKTISLFGRTWYAYSWKLNANNLRLAQMLSMLLEALK